MVRSLRQPVPADEDQFDSSNRFHARPVGTAKQAYPFREVDPPAVKSPTLSPALSPQDQCLSAARSLSFPYAVDRGNCNYLLRDSVGEAVPA